MLYLFTKPQQINISLFVAKSEFSKAYSSADIWFQILTDSCAKRWCIKLSWFGPQQIHARFMHQALVHTAIMVCCQKQNHNVFMHQAWLHAKSWQIYPLRLKASIYHGVASIAIKCYMHAPSNLRLEQIMIVLCTDTRCLHVLWFCVWHNIMVAVCSEWCCFGNKNPDRFFMHQCSVQKHSMFLLPTQFLIVRCAQPQCIKLSWFVPQNKLWYSYAPNHRA